MPTPLTDTERRLVVDLLLVDMTMELAEVASERYQQPPGQPIHHNHRCAYDTFDMMRRRAAETFIKYLDDRADTYAEKWRKVCVSGDMIAIECRLLPAARLRAMTFDPDRVAAAKAVYMRTEAMLSEQCWAAMIVIGSSVFNICPTYAQIHYPDGRAPLTFDGCAVTNWRAKNNRRLLALLAARDTVDGRKPDVFLRRHPADLDLYQMWKEVNGKDLLVDEDTHFTGIHARFNQTGYCVVDET